MSADDLIARLIKIADASRRSDGYDIPLGEQVREAADTIASLKEERDRFAERVATMEIASNGSSERCALLLSAKNHWMGRTAAAEASNEALKEENGRLVEENKRLSHIAAQELKP